MFVDVAQDEDVSVAVGLHVPVVGGVQQHCLLVPLHLRQRLAVHIAGHLQLPGGLKGQCHEIFDPIFDPIMNKRNDFSKIFR